ncbi:MAG TPA: PAS domain-containing protein, partial [Longimicrobiales bacterium]
MSEAQARTTGSATGEEAARPASARWDAAIAQSPLALAELDADTLAIRAHSPAFLELTGLGDEVPLDRALPDMLSTSGARKLRSALRACRSTGATHAPDISYVHPQRGSTVLDFSVWSFADPDDGRVRLAVHVSAASGRKPARGRLSLVTERIRDANEQLLLSGLRQAELAEQSREHARQVSDLITSQAAGVLVLDGAGGVVQANAPARRMLGLFDVDDAALAARLRQLDLHQRDGSAPAAADHPVERLLRGEPFSDLELTLRRAAGEVAHISFNGSAIADADGSRVALAILVFYEVTAQRQLDELRSDYISLIAHDLRSPLNSIIGYAELLRLGIGREPSGRITEWAERVDGAARQMAAMIDDLVESTRLESRALTLHKDPVYVGALILNVLAQLPSRADRARVLIDASDSRARVSVDHNRFERVLTNLLSNALKYSPADAPVTVRLREEAGELILSVSDRGAGLSRESMSRL